MATRVLKAGTKRAVHVFTKQLMERMKKDDDQCLWLVRSELYGYKKALVVKTIKINGPCTGEDLFKTPLPGTAGRGVAILFTSAEIEIEFPGAKPVLLDMED